MKLTGAEILIECLIEQGVDTIFGYPGGAVLNIYDALYQYQDKITHYLTAHEQGAAHAADGYARATGKIGVCLATSGPGATNLVTGIATAYMDSVPMVAITGNVAKNLLGKDSFQEVDITGITMPITKHNFIVKDVAKLAETVRRAFYIAGEGRPGPVLIDITKDVTAALWAYEQETPKPVEPSVKNIRDKDLIKAAELIKNARNPFIFAGGGVIIANAADELRSFVEKIDAPIALSSMGLGGFPSSSRYFTGLLGMHGTKTSNTAASECDLFIAIGARFSDRVVSDVKKFATNAKVLHLDVDPAEIDKNVLTVNSVIGDIKAVLHRLLPMIKKQAHPEWMARIAKLKAEYPLKYGENGTLKPQYVLEQISKITGGDAIITTEVGQHQMWACQYIGFEKPRTFLSSGGLGTMGYGLGASIGAAVGNPGKTVFNIAGDGCFRMNNIELATAVEYNIPIKIAIMNNHVLGMVRQWQSMFYGERYSHTTLGCHLDFVKLAQAHGALAFNVTKPEEVVPVLEQAIAHNGPVVMNFEIDRDERVYPMVPPGAGINEIIVE